MAESQAEKLRKARARRWLRRVLFALVPLFVAALMLPHLLPERLVSRCVASRIHAATGLDAKVGRAWFSWFSGLCARGVTVAQPPGFGEGNLAEIGGLSARIDLASLLGATPRIECFRLESADLRLVSDAHGEWNLPSVSPRVRVERVAVRDSAVHLTDLASGVSREFRANWLNIGPYVANERALSASVESPSAGAVELVGALRRVPGTLEFDRIQASLRGERLTLGGLVGLLAPRLTLPAALAAARVESDLSVEVRGERAVVVKGTVKILGLPSLPLLGFVGDDRALIIEPDVDVSPVRQHVRVGIRSHPNANVSLRATLDDCLTLPKLDAFLAVAAQDPLDAGHDESCPQRRAALRATAKGTLDAVEVSVRASVAGLPSTPPGGPRPGPVGMSFGADATIAPLELSARLSRFDLTAAGLTLRGSARVGPARGFEPKIDPQGNLPPMAVRGTAEAKVNFAQLPRGIAEFVGLSRPLPWAGKLWAAAAVALRDDGAGAENAPREGLLALADTHGPARPDDWRFGMEFDGGDVPLEDEFWLLREDPFLTVVAAVLGGKPDELSFVASSYGRLGTHGRRLSELRANLAGEGDSRLDKLRIVGSPLLGLLAVLTRKPAMKELSFERVPILFSVAGDRVEHDATLIFEQGAFLVKGTTTLGGDINYRMTVRNAKGISLLPEDLVPYFDDGQPALLISGTVQKPNARIPLECIAAFKLMPPLRKTPGKGD